MRLKEILIAFFEGLARRLVQRDGRALGLHLTRAALDRVAPQRLHHLFRPQFNLLPLRLPVPRDRVQQGDETRPAMPVLLREISAAIKRLALGRQPHAHRPATVPRRLLHVGHVHAVEVGPLLAVHLDRHVVAVEHRRHRRILERLVRHHVAPVTGRVADAEENGFPFRPGPGQRLVAPRPPVDGIVGVLAQVGRLLGGKAVGHPLTLAQTCFEAKGFRGAHPGLGAVPSLGFNWQDLGGTGMR